MWKQTLLQMIIAILPIFAYQVWHDRSNSRTCSPRCLTLTAAMAILLSGLISSATNRYDFGFAFIPVMFGSLYGGRAVMAILLAVDAVMELFRFGITDWLLLELAGIALLVLPALYMSIRNFSSSNRSKRTMTLLMLVTLEFAVKTSTLLVYPAEFRSGMGIGVISSSAVHVILYLFLSYFAAWLSVYLIENYIQQRGLDQKVKELSSSFRIEAQKLQQLIDENPLGILFVDQSGIISHLNGRAKLLYKRELPGEKCLIGAHYTALASRESGSVLVRLMEQALSGEPVSTEYVQEQTKMYAHTGISVRDSDNGRIVGAAIMIHDITELTQLRSEVGRMERLSLVGQMAASITHEIRNPMAVIRGFVQLMRERGQEDQKEYFRIVIEELDRANSIINDFLSLAQNRLIEKESCSLHDIIQELAPLISADANMRGIEIQFSLSESMPAMMLNPKEMKQLILNLARNGMEAMGQGGLLRIATEVTTAEVTLSISDSGCGIPKEKVDRLFEPFYTTKSHGTGLGLPLCLSIVERHNGKIKVDSIEGMGTTFLVSFNRPVSGS